MALRLGHAERVKQLYRHSLKTLLSWAVRRELFWEEAAQLRSEFDRNALVSEARQAERLVERGEQKLREYAHPDPYIVPYYPGGSLYARNPPVPKELHQQLDFGKEVY